MKKRLLASFLSLVLVIGLLPTAAFAAGTDTGKAIQLGASSISGWDSASGYDYIYYGYWTAPDQNTTSAPIKWRVLDDQTNTGEEGLFLLSDGAFGTGLTGGVKFQEVFHWYGETKYEPFFKGPSHEDNCENCLPANAWQGSDAQKWCQEFYKNSLTEQERGAVLATTKSDQEKEYTFEYNGPYTVIVYASENILKNDTVFFLSAEEVMNENYGFTDNESRKARYHLDSSSTWWLRSPCKSSSSSDPRVSLLRGVRVIDGSVSHSQGWAARPAFNLNLNSVLFTSAATGGKSADGMDSGLTIVPDYTSSEWKLTLLDSSRESFSISNATINGSGDTIAFSYSGAQTGTNEYISVVIEDNGAITHYGRILQPESASGTASLTLPDGVTLSDTTKLYVFNEQYNGDKMTDYASPLKEISDPILPTYTITAAPTPLDFDSVYTGYAQPDAQTVTVTNTGNQSVTITLPTLTNYIITAGEGWTDGSITLEPSGGNATFTVQPVTGLSAGNYDGTITVSTGNNTSASVAVKFTVTSSGGSVTPTPTRYIITAEAGEGGSISPDGRVRVDSGDDQTFRITADEGYEIADVIVDGRSVGAVSRYTFENVRANHTIEAVFEAAEEEPGVADPDDTGVSGWLDTQDHRAYLSGYPDGSFGPDRNMTRAEVAQMFYNLLLNKNVTITAAFDDVPADAWYAGAVNTLASLGMITGVGGNRFEPERSITRAEFTTIAMRFAKLPSGGENVFSDVARSDWFYSYVVGSIQYGWINGYPDGTFRPNNTITRAEVTTIVNNMLGRSADEAFVDSNRASLVQFTDLSVSHWAYYGIMEATNAHHYTKDGGAEDWTGLK